MNNRLNLLPIKEIISLSWNKVYGSKWSFNIAASIAFLAAFLIGVASGLVQMLDMTGLTVLMGIIQNIIIMLLEFGLFYLGLRRAFDFSISYKEVFYPFKWRVGLYLIGLQILLTIIFAVLSLIYLLAIGAYQLNIPFAGFITFVLAVIDIVIIVYFALRLSMSYLLVLDKNVNPWEAIKLSFAITQNQVLELFIIYLINALFIFAGVLTLGIGLIWTLPLYLIIFGEVYKRLRVKIS